MNLSKRSKLSVCQFLALFNRDELVLLLGKYELPTDELESRMGGQSVTAVLKEVVLEASASQLKGLIQELARTGNSMRTEISPRYRFDERWDDLCLCLKLDGYAIERDEYDRELGRFVPVEPVLEGVDAVEDDLTSELRRSGISDIEEILQVLEGSASSFRNRDFNGCLNNARVALQTLATSIAQARLQGHPGNFDAEKWGQIVAYLRKSDFVTKKQEEGLTGVFSFISPGSHKPIGFSEEEFARLGRSLAVSICYFLVKQLNAGEG